MIKIKFMPPILFLLLAALTACSDMAEETSEPLVISAAASLHDAMEEIRVLYEKKHDITIQYNFGGSGTLAKQIEQGAPVDLFLSASLEKFHHLSEKGLIKEGSETKLLQNTLVLISSNNRSTTLKSVEDIRGVDKIAIGIPESVPAGRYAKEALESLGMWTTLEQKMVQAKDVRQVLSYVQTGNVQAGFVYKTDAMVSDKVEIIAEIDSGTHSPIIYPVGIVKHSSNEEAERFYDFLQTKEALKIFEDYGFKTN